MAENTAYQQLQSRMEDVNRLYAADTDDAEWGDDARESYALSMEVVRTIDVVIAVGGPTEYFRFTFDSDDDDAPRAEFVYSWATGNDTTQLNDTEADTAWQVLGFGMTYADAAGIAR